MAAKSLLSRITANPKIFGGKPVIRGTRIPVETVLSLLAQGMTTEELVKDYRNIVAQDVFACLEYARVSIANESIEDVEVVKA